MEIRFQVISNKKYFKINLDSSKRFTHFVKEEIGGKDLIAWGKTGRE